MIDTRPTVDELIQSLLEEAEPRKQSALLRRRLAGWDNTVVDTLMEEVIQKVVELRRQDVDRALEIAEVALLLADVTDDPRHKAGALRAKAQVWALGRGEFQAALPIYTAAIACAEEAGDSVAKARIEVTRVYVLDQLGRHDEALAAGRWAMEVLETAKLWRSLASLTTNLAIARAHLGDAEAALQMFEKAGQAYASLGEEAQRFLGLTEGNRAVVLSQMGRFPEAIAASQKALELYRQGGYFTDAARVQQTQSYVYALLGRYNEALELLEEAHEALTREQSRYDAALVDLFSSECLLLLRRFPDALEKAERARAGFEASNTPLDMAEAIGYCARAFAGMERYGEALRALETARDVFAAAEHPVWPAMVDLETANIYYHQQRYAESLELSRACGQVLGEHERLVPQTQAWLIAARTAMSLGNQEEAGNCVEQILAACEEHDLAPLKYQALHLAANLQAALDREQALALLDQALAELERLRGNLMLEFRADFLEDKQVLYEDAVELALAAGQPARGLDYAERAKSRALLELLAYRIDLSLQAHSPEDAPLVKEILRLRDERDALYRRQTTGAEVRKLVPDAATSDTAARLGQLEKQITDTWHRLLVRNADYARDVSLWQVYTEPVQPYLEEDTVLLEFFVARQQIYLFLVSRSEVTALPLAAPLSQVQQNMQLLRLNLGMLARAGGSRAAGLIPNCRARLQQLYDQLLRPVTGQFEGYRHLYIVPHGSLHYLPFHALHDGERYLIESYEITYLPGASFLSHYKRQESKGHGIVSVGYSYHEHLPHTLWEAEQIATHGPGKAVLEHQATLDAVRSAAETCRVLHLATHGEFRPDNPLFSGLALADGWLTTLDIFNLRLQASLVTLSACETGQSVVAGGDELLGLMRAFLAAGAASLILSHWAVDDRSTAQLMDAFYSYLREGQTKGAALRQAQLAFIHAPAPGSGSSPGAYAHPYYWAPFFLVGDATSL